MFQNRPLTEKEAAFCRYYVEQGCTNGKLAAIRAGYGEKSAHVTASQLLKKPRIQDEVRRLIGDRNTKAVAVIDAVANDAKATRPATENPEAVLISQQQDEDEAAGLTRAYVVAGLIENFEMALGRRPTRITKMITHRARAADGQITTTVEAVRVDAFLVDGATANRAAELLMKEVDRREGVQANDARGVTEDGRPDLKPYLEAFRRGEAFEIPQPTSR